jgi:BirA family biotin operon repressor/biotin-[acetyl-CoA-carboxylase] ligase
MRQSLPEDLLREDPPLFHLSEVPSTQNWLKERLESNAFPPATAVVAERQTAGRGRPGNTWHHLPGNLAMSLWIPQDKTRMALPWTILTAHSVLLVLERAMGKVFGIKYPNDIIILESGLKVGGILVESMGERGDLIGIGLNRNTPPISGAGGMVVSGKPLPPGPLELPFWIQNVILEHFGGGFSAQDLLSFLDDRLLWKGQWISFSEGGKGARIGKILGLGEQGHLRVLDPQGIEFLLPVTVRDVRRVTP